MRKKNSTAGKEHAWLTRAGEAGPLDDLLGPAITYRIALGPRAGQKLFTLQTLHGVFKDTSLELGFCKDGIQSEVGMPGTHIRAKGKVRMSECSDDAHPA